jgi:hypothetical protein
MEHTCPDFEQPSGVYLYQRATNYSEIIFQTENRGRCIMQAMFTSVGVRSNCTFRFVAVFFYAGNNFCMLMYMHLPGTTSCSPVTGCSVIFTLSESSAIIKHKNKYMDEINSFNILNWHIVHFTLYFLTENFQLGGL